MIPKTAIRSALYGERGIALIKRKFRSLKLKLLLAVLISLLVFFVVFSIVLLCGDIILSKTVYAESFSDKMADINFFKLQDYVEQEGISTENMQQLNVWFKHKKSLYLTVYVNDKLIYGYPYSAFLGSNLSFEPEMENPDNEYILVLNSGEHARAFLYYYAGDAFYYLMTVLAGITAFVAFSACFIFLIKRKVSYIGLLKNELDILAGGQLDYQVTICGNDELSDLAVGIDQMRKSILRHQETESQVRSANSELITSISHDLRTPLTSLLAYLEIIERGKYADEEQMKSLIHKSVVQTMRIRNMANKMFEYFLAYATEWESAQTETADADELFLQILGDYAYSLESKGMTVKTDFSAVSGKVKVNTELLQRALDNLYSNLLKYADPDECVLFSYKRSGQFLKIEISNGIKKNDEKSESTNIGLITCQRIIEYHGGNFKAEEKENRFNVSVEIPTQQ